MSDNTIIVLVGKRGTGKSVLVKDILYHNRDIPVATVISPTEEANQYFSDFIPPLFIHYEYSPELVKSAMDRQKKIVKKLNKGELNEEEYDPRALIVFDDALYDESWKRDRTIREIFMNGRHWKVTYILTM
jgi:Cdc6-like AAA superfamily ATPase